MTSLVSYDCWKKVAAQRVSSFRICLFLLMGLAPSQLFSSCGMVDSDMLAINVQQLTGLTGDQLILMPKVRYDYSNGHIKASFGKTPKPCSGPICDQMPENNRVLSEMSMIDIDTFSGVLLATHIKSNVYDDIKSQMKLASDQFIEQVSQPPDLRPPISVSYTPA